MRVAGRPRGAVCLRTLNRPSGVCVRAAAAHREAVATCTVSCAAAQMAAFTSVYPVEPEAFSWPVNVFDATTAGGSSTRQKVI